jgi:hypothetical protein
VKRLIYFATVALVAMLILVPTVMAQTTTGQAKMEQTTKVESTQPLPKSGGPMLGGSSLLLPAAALLLGSGVLGYAVLRRR